MPVTGEQCIECQPTILAHQATPVHAVPRTLHDHAATQRTSVVLVGVPLAGGAHPLAHLVLGLPVGADHPAVLPGVTVEVLLKQRTNTREHVVSLTFYSHSASHAGAQQMRNAHTAPRLFTNLEVGIGGGSADNGDCEQRHEGHLGHHCCKHTEAVLWWGGLTRVC